MTTLRIALVAVLAVASFGCSKKNDESASSSSKSGLAWTPMNYDKMSDSCKKTLACCEEIAKANGAKSAEDYNLKCSGPAMWKDDECAMDLKSRITVLESDGKPVPDACK